MIAFARRHWHEALVCCVCAAIILWILWPRLAGTWNAPAARRQLIEFTAGLRLGMSKRDVGLRLTSAYPLLSANDVDAHLTLIDTPMQFGAMNWRAWLDFGNDRLVSIRIRTLDGEHDKPAGSPPDVGAPPATSTKSP